MHAPGCREQRPTWSPSSGGQRSALTLVPAADRDVLLLVAWEDLTYDEVACALAIPVGTVRSRLHRARTRLRRLLADIDYKEIVQ